MKIAITVDVERDLGFLSTTFGIDEALPNLIRTLREYGIKATFFVSGEAVEHPATGRYVREAAEEGHEIASHGLTHTDYRLWRYDRIREEICLSKKVLEDLTGKRVKGFRAPQFLISEEVMTAVRECGFLYDSSLPDESGFSAARHLRRVETGEALRNAIRRAGLREFGIPSIPVVRVPHGLLWINLIGLTSYKAFFSRSDADVMLFYLHPFDLVVNKHRVPLNLKRKLFYLRKGNSVQGLFRNLTDFWVSRGVSFVRIEDLL